MAKSTKKTNGAGPVGQPVPKATRRVRAASVAPGDGVAAAPRRASAAGSTGAARPRKAVSTPLAREVAADSRGAGDGPAPSLAPTYEQIAWRAYEIYQRRGGTPGSPIDDWLQAEAELRGSR